MFKVDMGGKFRPTVSLGILAIVTVVYLTLEKLPGEAKDIVMLMAGGLVAIVTLLVNSTDPSKKDKTDDE